MTALAQHRPFDAALTEPDPPTRPWWMPAREAGPEWHVWRSGDFPTVKDKALIEEEKPA